VWLEGLGSPSGSDILGRHRTRVCEPDELLEPDELWPAAPAGTSLDEQSGMSTGELILLVDDIPDHFASYAQALRTSGFRVRAVSSGAEALDIASDVEPDMAVIDERLPDMTGWEVCRGIKQKPDVGHVPILLLTSDVTKTSAADSARSGCSAWLAHPTRASDLVRAVEQVLALDLDEPPSPEEAVIGVASCPACAGERIKATLRMHQIQYYTCTECNLRWRVDGPR